MAKFVMSTGMSSTQVVVVMAVYLGKRKTRRKGRGLGVLEDGSAKK